MALPDLNEAEQLLWDAFADGAWVDLRESTGRVIDANVIKALLLGAREAGPGSAPAVRLRGATVAGRLDLMGASVSCPLICEDCEFDSEVRLVEATTRTIRLVRCRLPSFNGTRMRLDGIINFAGSAVVGVLRLDQAQITGEVCLLGTAIGPATEGLSAVGLVVNGGVECTDLTVTGPASLEIALVSGSVTLTRGQFRCPGKVALNLDNATIGGELQCSEVVVEGITQLRNCHLAASVVFSGASLTNERGLALSASGLTAEGAVYLRHGFAAVGEVRLIGARLSANLELTRSTFSNPGAVAVNLDRATIAVFNGALMKCRGQLSLIGARIAGDLNLRGARLTGTAKLPALIAEGISIDGVLDLAKVRATGEIDLRTVQVRQRLLLWDSRLSNRGKTAFRLSRGQVAADMFCDGMTVIGGMRLAGATIGGGLTLKQVRLMSGGSPALDAPGLRARELDLLPAEPIEGLVDLGHARIGVLRDDPAVWPAQLNIVGMTYDALEPLQTVRERLRWLERDTRGHQPQPYEQLAAHYAAIGQPSQARIVLYARERRARQAMRPLARTWSLMQDAVVGYGYQPWRALAWLGALLAVGSITFAMSPPPPLQASPAPHFNPVAYTIDLLLPLVNLGQKSAFNPAGAEQWLSYLLTASGWVLVTTIAAGAARVLRRS